jgi:hypothetical protein
MKTQWIFRLKPGAAAPPNITDFDLHTYPFDSIPLIESHLHPNFVIFDAGEKLRNLEPENYNTLSQTFPALKNCFQNLEQLYQAWTRPLSPKQLQELKVHIPSNDDKRYDDDGDGEDDGEDEGDGDDGHDEDYDDRARPRPKRKAPSVKAPTNRKRRNPGATRRSVLSQMKSSNHGQHYEKVWTSERIYDWNRGSLQPFSAILST